MDKKKLKYVKNTDSVSSKLRMFLYSGMQDYRINSKYIDMICPDSKSTTSATEQLNEIIEEALVKEFSPKIKESPNFHLLVDAVANKLKKNSLKQN